MADEAGLTPEELAFKKKYGRLPPKKKGNPLARLTGGDRKFFDSADHALSTAGVKKAPPGVVPTGSVVATTANIPKRSHHHRPTSMSMESTADDAEKLAAEVARAE
eukprot:m.285778 g.285778  ORF g.285778 m.285778 type:complete len:106 (+) comp11437_c0_seq1:78-395(+)